MKHVFIVEDKPKVLSLARQSLEGKYRISIAASAETTLEFLMINNPDLILMSMDIAGNDLISSIRTILGARTIPIVAILSQGDTLSEQRANEQDVAEILQMPFEKVTLLKRVDTLLELESYRSNTLEYIGVQDTISVSIAELVECRDTTTGGHVKNTTVYFKLLVEELTNYSKYKAIIRQEDVMDALRATPLHDIGKIGISDEILRKASTLNYDEFEYMKTHTTLGKKTFEKIMKETGETRFLRLAKDLAYYHHERWDGTGYPCGLRGKDIPLYARILTIADVYDALTSRRTYKEAYTHAESVEIIQEGKGKIFDPELVEIFMNINDRFEEALAKRKAGAV